MTMRPDEIVAILRRQIEELDSDLKVEAEGTVLTVGDGIARVYGLQEAMAGELLEFPGNTYGMVLNLEHDNLGAVILGPYEHIKEGDTVKRTGRIVEVPVGEELIGRVVNPLGQPLDGKGPIGAKKFRPIESQAPGVVDRQAVSQPLQTGLKAVDSMIPIGRGQRELIIGDRQTGKTAIAIDTILNQHDQDVICIYVAIGQNRRVIAEVAEPVDHLFRRAAGDAQLEPALGDEIGGTCVLSEVHRVFVAHVDHTGADFDALGLRPDRRQQRKRAGQLAGEMVDPEVGAVGSKLFGRHGQVDALQQRVAA